MISASAHKVSIFPECLKHGNCSDRNPLFELANKEDAILSTGEDNGFLGVEVNASDCALVTGKLIKNLRALDVPNGNRPVSASNGDALSAVVFTPGSPEQCVLETRGGTRKYSMYACRRWGERPDVVDDGL